MENWRGWDWDETQNDAHIMRRQGCAMQNQGITLSAMLILFVESAKTLLVKMVYLVARSMKTNHLSVTVWETTMEMHSSFCKSIERNTSQIHPLWKIPSLVGSVVNALVIVINYVINGLS